MKHLGTGRSWKFFHRASHREGVSVEQLIDHLNGEILQAKPKRWSLSADGKHYLFSGMVALPKVSDWDDESNTAVIMIESPGGVANFPLLPGIASLPCPHETVETRVETEEYYSNGLFGIPASNMPLRTDIIGETTHCVDCGAQVDPLPTLYDRKPGWDNDGA